MPLGEARTLIGTTTKTPFAAGINDLIIPCGSVGERVYHLLIAEDVRQLPEREVRRRDDRCTWELVGKLKQQQAAAHGERTKRGYSHSPSVNEL